MITKVGTHTKDAVGYRFLQKKKEMKNEKKNKREDQVDDRTKIRAISAV